MINVEAHATHCRMARIIIINTTVPPGSIDCDDVNYLVNASIARLSDPPRDMYLIRESVGA